MFTNCPVARSIVSADHCKAVHTHTKKDPAKQEEKVFILYLTYILINDVSNCYVGVQEMSYLMVYKLLV